MVGVVGGGVAVVSPAVWSCLLCLIAPDCLPGRNNKGKINTCCACGDSTRV